MIQDGWGYGKSTYWQYKAKDIAKNQNEACKHLFKDNAVVKIQHTSGPHYLNLTLKVKCPKCETQFPCTEDILTTKFMEFYGK